MNDLEIRLMVYQAFCLGNISGNIRTLSYEYVQNEIKILATTFHQPTDDDIEGIDVAITEIMASIPDITAQSIKIFQDNGFIKDMPSYKTVIFIRQECQVFKN